MPYTNVINRDTLWTHIRDLKRFTITDIICQSKMHKTAIKEYLNILIMAGYVVERRDGMKPVIYSLVKDNGKYRPDLSVDGKIKPPTGRQRMWMAMKALKRFSHREVSIAANVGKYEAQDYCRHLRKAKYLKVVETSQPNRPEIYVFDRSKDTGLYAPQIKKEHVVWDRNINKVMWPESVSA